MWAIYQAWDLSLSVIFIPKNPLEKTNFPLHVVVNWRQLLGQGWGSCLFPFSVLAPMWLAPMHAATVSWIRVHICPAVGRPWFLSVLTSISYSASSSSSLPEPEGSLMEKGLSVLRAPTLCTLSSCGSASLQEEASLVLAESRSPVPTRGPW